MSVAVANPTTSLNQVNVKMKGVSINDNVVENASEKTEEDLYKELKGLQKKLEFLDIKTDYVKDEMKNLKREMIGEISTEMLTHFIESVVTAARLTVHVTNLEGTNDHHRSESAFKALAVALKMAFAYKAGAGVLSTKDLID